eukprot:936754-Rhodomonas_salina.8
MTLPRSWSVPPPNPRGGVKSLGDFRVPAKFPNHQAGFGKVNLGSVVPGLGEGSNNSGSAPRYRP